MGKIRGKIIAWKDLHCCSIKQYTRRERSEHGRMCSTTVLKEGKIRAWKDVQYHSIEGGKDQSMEGCAVPQY
jgi:hypothetical protein